MYLFFNGVAVEAYIGLYSDQRELIACENFHISGNESTKTIPVIDDFLNKCNVSYTDISNIVCVVWPGSFTGIRTISLVVNTLAYIYPNIYLTAINFFDLFENYPIVKSSSKRDLFVKREKSDTIEILSNSDFEDINTQKMLYGDVDISRFEKNYTLETYIDYDICMKNIVLEKEKKLAPLYIKKPNIS